jgi:sulfur carrier protein ThiS
VDKGLLFIGAGTLAVLGIIMVIVMSSPEQKLTNTFDGTDNDIVSQEGIHWHPELAIYIKGQKQEIPTNIGIGGTGPMGMEPLHTHDSSGQIHAEWQVGPIKKGNLKLARFFEQWAKTFNKDQILDSKTGEEGTVKMTVNGQPNTDYENYIMKDGDKIEIRYE